MESIKTIEKFDNPYDLLFDHDFDVDSNPDFSEYLKTVNDWEPIHFFVINYETVLCVDSINGDVFNTMPITEFYKESVKDFIRDFLEHESGVY